MSLSSDLYKKAKEVIPGGVNSPVRAFKGVGGNPIFMKEGIGPYLIDVDGKKYIDFICSWGALILGHCDPKVMQAGIDILNSGITFGAPTELEIDLAKAVINIMPSIEKIRMLNSGTEATMTAVRLARAYTNRKKIIKFHGCYHGHTDALLVKAGSGLLTCGIPATPGVLENVTQHTLVADYNNLVEVEKLFLAYPEDIAAVIVEPIAGNMNLVFPADGFLQGLRDLCTKHGSILIFDEVMTGFRVALGGAQELYNIKPDLTTLGKIIGGGMPVGAVGGRAHIMDFLAPEGPVYQAGTLSGNPLAMATGLATIKQITAPGFYEKLNNFSKNLMQIFKAQAEKYNINLWTGYVGGMFGFQFIDKDLEYFKRFYNLMLENGIYLAPSMYEAGFISIAHVNGDGGVGDAGLLGVFDAALCKSFA